MTGERTKKERDEHSRDMRMTIGDSKGRRRQMGRENERRRRERSEYRELRERAIREEDGHKE